MRCKSNIGNVSVADFEINKRGIIGSFLISAIATIVIAAILIVFVLMAGAVKTATGVKTGLEIHDESKVGIEGGEGYMENYAKLVSAEGRVSDGLSVSAAIAEVKYEES